MRVSDGAAGFLGALGLTALAVGLAYGAHAFTSVESPDVLLPGPQASDSAQNGDVAAGGTDTQQPAASPTSGGTDSPPRAEGVAAMNDVSILGQEMATYYVGWQQGDPKPVIAVTGGNYVLNGTVLGRQSEGIALTGQYARGPDDWCVSAAPADAPEDSWTYSALSGLVQGTCS